MGPGMAAKKRGKWGERQHAGTQEGNAVGRALSARSWLVESDDPAPSARQLRFSGRSNGS